MRFTTLDQWLEWQTELHGKAIDLGLERVREVAVRLDIGRIAQQVVTVAGTNGKGSTVAAYEHWLGRSGYSVASYTSPHLLRYNERIKHNQQEIDDHSLCQAFDAVEQAREEVSLTYFEFGTLAALYLINQWQPDYAILEVGLGGRLDAVNIVDADLVHLTPIGIDHQAWLGDDREQIGFEKAGVLREGIAVVLNDRDPPRSVLQRIEDLQCRCLRLGQDYDLSDIADDDAVWRSRGQEWPLQNVLTGEHQFFNLAGVLAGLSQLLDLSRFAPDSISGNFQGLQVAGRLQQVNSALPAALYVDVGHNADAARVLATSLPGLKSRSGELVVLLGMLEDKEPAQFVEALKPMVDRWWLVTLEAERGLSATALAERIGTTVDIERCFENVNAALDHALSSLGNQDIMLVTGSFVTVELLLRALPDSCELNNYGSKP